mmetsp:Transcript_13021/g.36624  ORF Transcript_13021/g.36624 Transcript_13021/m.36624 type:complete len:752 (+) Transcript_13021:215-2470(+)
MAAAGCQGDGGQPPSWKLDSGQPDSLRLDITLPESVQSIRDLDVSVENLGGSEQLVVAVPSHQNAILLKVSFPGVGEDSEGLRASFSKRTRQLKITVSKPPGLCAVAPTLETAAADDSADAGGAAGPSGAVAAEVCDVEGSVEANTGGLAGGSPAASDMANRSTMPGPVLPSISPVKPGQGPASTRAGAAAGADFANDVRQKVDVLLKSAEHLSGGGAPMDELRLRLSGFPVAMRGSPTSSGSGCCSGRHLVAQCSLPAGTVVLEDEPLVAAVSDKYRAALCAHCLKRLPPESSGGGTPCDSCHALLYCGHDCRESDKANHEVECSFLKMYLAKNPGAGVQGMRLILRLLWMRHCSRGGGGWSLFDLMQEIPLNQQPAADTPPAMAEFTAERWRQLLDEISGKAKKLRAILTNVGVSEAEIASVLSKLQANLVGISNWLGGNLGSGVYPVAWLFNHSCEPNVVLSFRGTRLVARTMTEVVEGEALTIGYTELYETTDVRQRNLFSSKGFICQCPRCDCLLVPGEGAGCIAAWTNPRRAGGWLFFPGDVCICAQADSEAGDGGELDGSAIKVMTEQNQVWRERVGRGLTYLARARELPESDPRHSSALEQALEVLEKVLQESSGRLHQHHAIRFTAMQGAADAAKALGQTDACLTHARAAAECMREHCGENHPGRARLLQLLGECEMRQGVQQLKGDPMRAKLLLAGSRRQLQEGLHILAVAYGDDHPDLQPLMKSYQTAAGLLDRLKKGPG